MTADLTSDFFRPTEQVLAIPTTFSNNQHLHAAAAAASTTNRTRRTKAAHQESGTESSTSLPRGFQPGENDVICGRGRSCFDHPGNKRFRDLVRGYVDDYERALSKLDKTIVLSNIVDRIHEATGGVGGFVKRDPNNKGAWIATSDEQAREKVGHAIRDAVLEKDQAPQQRLLKNAFEQKHKSLLESQRAIFEQLVKNATRRKKEAKRQQQNGRKSTPPLWVAL